MGSNRLLGLPDRWRFFSAIGCGNSLRIGRFWGPNVQAENLPRVLDPPTYNRRMIENLWVSLDKAAEFVDVSKPTILHRAMYFNKPVAEIEVNPIPRRFAGTGEDRVYGLSAKLSRGMSDSSNRN
jgi:hypothetical protein